MEGLQELISVPSEERDASWKKKFYESIQNAPLSVGEEFLGPDGFSYIKTVIENSDSTERIFIKNLLDTCLAQGRGIACFDGNNNLVWVFSYGAVRSLKERGNFEAGESNAAGNNDTVEKMPVSGMPTSLERRTVTEERKAFIGQPSETFFPTYARKIVKEYLEAHGIVEPRMILFMDPTLTPPQSLLFSIFPEDFSDEQYFQIFMERLSWFFPNPYGVISMSKESTKDYQFEPL